MQYNCKVCNSVKLHKVLDLGRMPSANELVLKKYLNSVKSYPLEYYWCEECTFFQQMELINRDELFGGFYTYQTGVNLPAVEHFKELALMVKENIKNKDFAIVVASNDGTEISALKEFGEFKKVIGVEPAKNLAKMANDKGLLTINNFFGTDLSKKIVKDYGKADLVVASNVFAHIPNPKDLLLGMKECINDEGSIIIEVHWLKSLVDNLQIDALYGEHYYVWSIKAMEKIAQICGLNISKADYLPEQHGGSIRVTFSKTKQTQLNNMFVQEKASGLYDLSSMKKLQKKAEERKEKIIAIVKRLKSQNKRISLWTVPAKIVTILNFCNLSNKEIDYAYDLTPGKIGKYIPMANILIKDEKLIAQDMPDYLIVGAWNYIEFGKQKLKWYTDKGGKLINPLTCEIIG